jgi:endoglucanase
VATGVVSVPLRYMHSPVELADVEDIERAVQLVVAFALRLDSLAKLDS